MEQSILRGMTTAALQGVVLHLKGKARDESPFENPLLAAFHFEVTCNGLHQNKMLSVVLFRDRVTTCDINAMERSNLRRCELALLTLNKRRKFSRQLKAKEFTGKLIDFHGIHGHCELLWAVSRLSSS
jgi:hypothetical protein